MARISFSIRRQFSEGRLTPAKTPVHLLMYANVAIIDNAMIKATNLGAVMDSPVKTSGGKKHTIQQTRMRNDQ